MKLAVMVALVLPLVGSVQGVELPTPKEELESGVLSDEVYVTQAYNDNGDRLTVKVKDDGYNLTVIAIRTQYGWTEQNIHVSRDIFGGGYSFLYMMETWYL